MSGGHFNDYDYTYYKVYHFADQLENELTTNKYEFDLTTRNVLVNAIPEIRRAADLMKHIDYLFSGDYGEDTFHDRLRNDTKR